MLVQLVSQQIMSMEDQDCVHFQFPPGPWGIVITSKNGPNTFTLGQNRFFHVSLAGLWSSLYLGSGVGSVKEPRNSAFL